MYTPSLLQFIQCYFIVLREGWTGLLLGRLYYEDQVIYHLFPVAEKSMFDDT